MNNRTLIIIASILLVGIATNWLISKTEEDAVPEPGRGNDPDLYMKGAKITQFDEDGAPQHTLSAQRMTHFPLTDVTTLDVPNVLLFPAQSTGGPWDIIASDGRLLPSSVLRNEIVELWDQVVAVKDEADFIHIQTESLTVFPERDFAQTDVPVSINSVTSHTTAGGGMRAWLADGRFELFASNEQRVVTVLSPGTFHRENGARP